MKFFKDNSYDIVKLLVNQIGITIFSLVLYTAVGFVEDEALFSKITVIVSIFSTVFFFALLYTAAWDNGAKDIIRIEGGKLERVCAKGALMSLIANVPNFVIALGSIISMLAHVSSGSDGAYTAFAIFNLIIRFTNAMYLGVIQGICSLFNGTEDLQFLWQSIGYFILPMLAVLATHLGYEAGIRNFRLFGAFAKKNAKPENKNK